MAYDEPHVSLRRYRRYKNLIRGFVPTRPNQLWVSDITYIDLVDDCCYLHLVTDAYSHKIVGWCLSETLESEHTLEALRMAISQATADELKGLIHHSDRGVQYCCNAYTDELKKYGVKISMTEDYKPTDNAIAERVNGILKTEVIYRERRFKTYQDALDRISGFILFYNDTRPHYSIGMPPAAGHPLSVFHGVGFAKASQRIQYEVIFSDEKVNVSSTKSTNPGKETTKAGKQTT